MRFIKLVVISAAVLFVLVTALSLLLPSRVRVSRAINISGTREEIAPFINNLSQWRRWNRFVQHADSMKAVKQISGSMIETSMLEIRLLKHAIDTIETEWKQRGGKDSEAYFVLLPGEHYTVLQWYFDFHLNWYPWEKFQSIIYDKQLGPFMETSLNNMKQIVETSQ